MIAARRRSPSSSAPSGARAASAGFLLTIAADIARWRRARTSARRIPVAGSGEKMDETMAKKAAEDVAAYARTLASRRHRNVDARRGGRDARAARSPRRRRSTRRRRSSTSWPPDIPELLQKLDGRTVTPVRRRDDRAENRRALAWSLSTMSLRQRVLSAIAHPNVAYLLLSLGTLGLTIELWSPGRRAARRRGRTLPAAGVLRVAGAARELSPDCC